MKAAGKRLLRWLLVLCGVAALGPVAHFCWCSTLGSAALLCAVPCALAWLLLRLGKRLLGRGRRWEMALVTIAVAVFVAGVAFLANVAWQAGPWHDGIVTHRTAPDGREYVLSQAWVDWFGGYETRLFVREADGEWHSCWRVRTWKPMFESGCEIRLPEPDEGKPDVRLANGTDWWFSPVAPAVHPAETTPEELHAFHRAEMAKLRAGKTRSGKAPQGDAPMTALLQQTLPIPCAVARQDAASPETGRHLGGPAFSRALEKGARLESRTPQDGWMGQTPKLRKKEERT